MNRSSRFPMQACSIQGSGEWNEDVLVVNEKERIYGVIDGATSLTPYRNEDGRTGGYIAAHLLGSFLHDMQEYENLPEVVLKANAALYAKMTEAGVDVSRKDNVWSAAFAVFRIHDTYVEYAQAGDCMLFAKYEDGTVRALTRCQVAPFDAKTKARREEAVRLGYTEKEDIFQYILPTLRENRAKANTLSGYSVLNGDPALAGFLESGRISRACLTRLYAMTDGLFFPAASDERTLSWQEMIAKIDEWGLEAYANRIIELEESDPSLTKYSRVKMSDDKTAIVLDVGNVG